MAAADFTSVEYRDLEPLGFPGYRVGSDGSVWSCHVSSCAGNAVNRRGAWRRLTGGQLPTGHRYAVLRPTPTSGQIKPSIHRLVLLAFVGPCPEGMEACHNDGNPANNAIDNLRWDTHANNMRDMARHGTSTKGVQPKSTILTPEEVEAVRADYASARAGRGKVPNGTLSRLAAKHGVGPVYISQIGNHSRRPP